MTSDEYRAHQLETGDTMPCESCGKAVAWDEYAANFGWCDECLNKHLKQDGLA